MTNIIIRKLKGERKQNKRERKGESIPLTPRLGISDCKKFDGWQK